MIYIISHYYPPVVNPPANRMSHLVKLLTETHGADQVCVITGRPNHPHGVLPPEYKWKLFKRRRGEWGEQVLHLYETSTPNEGFIRKTLGYVSFATALFFHLLFKRSSSKDVFFVTTPPVFTAYAVYFASRFRRKLRYILDVRDLWPQAIAGIGFIREGSRTYRFFCRLSERTYQNATQLVGNSQGIVDHLATVSGCADKRIDLIHNPIDTGSIKPMGAEAIAEFRNRHPDIFGDTAKTTFLYSGVHAVYTDLIALLEALKLVKADTDNFLFLLIGYGEQKEELQQYAHDNDLDDNVKFLDFMPKPELLHYINAVDCCYVSLKDSPTLRYAIPSKTLEYLACGKPVIAVLSGPFADLLRNLEMTTVLPPGNHDDLAHNIETMLAQDACKHPPETATRFIEEHFSLAHFRKQIPAIFQQVTTQP